MSEKILRALIELFALAANAERMTAHSRQIVEIFLRQQLSSDLVEKYLTVFDEFLTARQKKSGSGPDKRSEDAEEALKICTAINHELNVRQKYIVLIRLIEFIHASNENVLSHEWPLITTMAGVFKIPEADYEKCAVIAGGATVPDSESYLVINNSEEKRLAFTHHIYAENISGQVVVAYLKKVSTLLFRYSGESEMTLNGQPVKNDFVYVFTPGSVIRGKKIESIYYSDVIHRFVSGGRQSEINFISDKVEYRFEGGHIGLHPVSFRAVSGELIGIMGSSGAGKSTLLNVLNGNLVPTNGNVLINNVNLHKDRKSAEGIIGYIPQDDLLMDELSVYQNLYYNTKLSYGGRDEIAINRKVTELLDDLGLAETRDRRVGNPLDKTISGGQRKRLNIALELIREPPILFVDEPTSGLSSRDSENVMDLLKQLTIAGKLVFVVIHQPSSDIFKLFDKLLLLDTGGYPIYYGNPSDSLLYFKRAMDNVNADESECATCGNINSEQLFSIIEANVLDEFGNPVHGRKTSPPEWSELFAKNILSRQPAEPISQKRIVVPANKPTRWGQFKVFIARDVLSKLSNRQYLLINLLEAPLLALTLAFLIRYRLPGHEYIFRENQNIPAFIFISVIVALFIGLSVSAEEIFRDRKILKRESFLNLSRSSYLLSKISIMFILSAIQTFSFVIIGNTILGIGNMYADYWLVLFSTACFANLLGLNISSSFNSAVTIYILIPILIIPQILLSGIIVKFEKLNPTLSTHSTVPVFGEVMASRWAFEAIAVRQFKSNQYEKYFFEDDRKMSKATYKKDFLIPELIKKTDYCIFALTQKEKQPLMPSELKLLSNELTKEQRESGLPGFAGLGALNPVSFNAVVGDELKKFLNDRKDYYIRLYNAANAHREEVIAGLQQLPGGLQALLDRKDNYENESLNILLKNTAEKKQMEESDEQLVQRFQPVFMEGEKGSFIRAPFFASRKNVFGSLWETYYVNVLVIWFMTLVLSVTLYFDVLKKLLGFRLTRRLKVIE
jgi:ABC-type multidrug transport system ATPase subunit